MPRDYSVTVKVRNNRLLEKMRACGFETSADLARACKVSIGIMSSFLCLKLPPMTRGGNWRAAVLAISRELRCLPEDLFPAAHLCAPLRQNTAEFKVDAGDVHQISTGLRSLALPADEKMMIRESKHALDRVLDVLTPRERNIIEQRFGLVDGIERHHDKILGERCTRERVRQLEIKALRKLRHEMRNEPELARAARQMFNQAG